MRELEAPNINHLWSRLVIEELTRLGVTYFVVSPGSRSTPITVAVAENPKALAQIHYDERGAAYHALGYARATGQPAALICTSGTAVANYYPAVIEAAQDNLPLVVLSADRPPELVNTAANQTIDQPKLFQGYTRWEYAFPPPSTTMAPQAVLTTIDQAIFRALGIPPGPVHLNFMFREPLEPKVVGGPFDEYLQPIRVWLEKGQPYTLYQRPELGIEGDELKSLLEVVNRARTGYILVGRMPVGAPATEILDLAERTGFRFLPDIQSGLRFLAHPQAVSHFDLLLNDFKALPPADLILHFGGPFVSKRLLQWLEWQRETTYVLINELPSRQDPVHRLDYRYQLAPHTAARALLASLSETSSRNSTQLPLPNLETRLNEWLGSNTPLSEPAAVRSVIKSIPHEHGLFLASSMPIRDADRFAPLRKHSPVVAANRGVSGIDGLISSATGFARGLRRPVTLIIGDLAFFHDLNALHLVKQSPYPLTIVLLNNGGGGIFHFLPIAKYAEVFEAYFATPHQLNFRAAAELFGLNYSAPQTLPEFVRDYQHAVNDENSWVIEIQTDRRENMELHRSLDEKVKRLLGNNR